MLIYTIVFLKFGLVILFGLCVLVDYYVLGRMLFLLGNIILANLLYLLLFDWLHLILIALPILL